MTSSNILFIVMDVHKESIEIAIADGTNQEVRRYGKIGGTRDAMRKTLRKLVSLGKSLPNTLDTHHMIDNQPNQA